MSGPLVGISVADFSPVRGHTDASVYRNVDYIEYGGFARPGACREIAFARSANAALKFGRHLVSTELPGRLDHAAEAERIRGDVEGFASQYFLTDVGYWSFGGRGEANVWPRPCSLAPDIAEHVRANCRRLKQYLGVAVLAENPAIIAVEARMSVAEFMAHIGRDAEICLDIGHFWAFCRNYDLDPMREVEKLPLESVRVMHIAGLSQVEFAGRRFFLDNHDVVPNEPCLALLHHLTPRCPRLGWVTYEAEMASVEVQQAGLEKVKQACLS